MDRDTLIKRLMATFLGELDEHVRGLNRDLMALEKGEKRAEAFGSMLRASHSLKGAARSVDAGPIEAASHLLEDLFAAGRDGRLALTPEMTGLLFGAVDAIEEAGARLREQADLAGSPLVALIPGWRPPPPGSPRAARPRPRPKPRRPRRRRPRPSRRRSRRSSGSRPRSSTPS